MAATSVIAGFVMAQQDRQIVDHARRTKTPDEFEKWQRERTEERRHRETLRAIRDAGDRASRSRW